MIDYLLQDILVMLLFLTAIALAILSLWQSIIMDRERASNRAVQAANSRAITKYRSTILLLRQDLRSCHLDLIIVKHSGD